MKNCLVNQRYNIMAPNHIADWDAITEWERVRFLSMEKNLSKGKILYDIGSEQGWQSIVYAQFVGGENMVLVEPSAVFWPNIRQTWEANDLPAPHATYQGLVGRDAHYERGALGLQDWPDAAEGELTKEMSYRYIHDDDGKTAQNMIDNFGIMEIDPPDAITIDVEGAELEVLRGAEKTLKERKPLVWCSVHPDLMKKDYDTEEHELHDFMRELGYTVHDLGWDGHETHIFYQP